MKPKIVFKKGEFEDYFALSVDRLNQATEVGMNDALKTFKNDALEQTPKVPVRSGWLKRHHRIRIERGRNLIGILETYDTPYARTVHSGISRHGTPMTYKTDGSGSHWISAKLYRNAARYFDIIQRRVGK